VLWDQARAQDQRTYRRVLEQAADMWLEFEHWTLAVSPRTQGVSQYGERPLETLVASAPETARDGRRCTRTRSRAPSA
jgi:hypothetical protein